MKKNYLLLITLFIGISLFAQKEYIEINKNYSTARIYKKGYKIIKVTSLKLTNDTLVTFKKVNSIKVEQLSINDIKYFSVKKGSHALTYGLIGGGIGLLSSLYAVASTESDPSLPDVNINYTPIVVGFTVGCGAIGAIIGACNPKWKRLYISDNNSSYSLMLVPRVQSKYYCLGLYFNF